MKAASALKTAILDALAADSAVSAIAGGRVFDVPPRDNRGLPSDIGRGEAYVYLGPVGLQRDAACAPLWRATVRIYAVSFKPHREEAWALAGAVTDALEGAELTLSQGAHTPALWVQQGGDVVDPVMPVLVFVDVTTDIHD